MAFKDAVLLALVVMGLSGSCVAQDEPKLIPATSAILNAFKSHDLVMFGETHGNKQEYEWLRSLIATPEFADQVDDIVVEFGNSLYQPEVDRYISGEDIPLDQVQGAWLDTVASVGAPSPVYASLYRAVREANMRRHGQHQMRVLCGDPNIDWKKITTGTEVWPYLSRRDQSYTQVVEHEVIEKHHRALLIMGSFHFLRNYEPFPGFKNVNLEHEFQLRGAKTYLVVFGTDTTDYSGKEDPRFASWTAPIVVSLENNWVGDLPALPVVTKGERRPAPIMIGPKASEKVSPSSTPPPELKLKDAADALLYVGPRDTLVSVGMPSSELKGTVYGKEIERRQKMGATPPGIQKPRF